MDTSLSAPVPVDTEHALLHVMPSPTGATSSPSRLAIDEYGLRKDSDLKTGSLLLPVSFLGSQSLSAHIYGFHIPDQPSSTHQGTTEWYT